MLRVGILSAGSLKRRVGAAGALARTGDPAAAVDALASLLDQAPDDLAANVEMARALTLLDDPSGAEEHYRRAIAMRLDYSLVVELAQAIAAQGRIAEAEDHLAAALNMAETNPRLDAGEVHLARAMLYAGDGRNADARTALAAIPPRSSRSIRDLAQRIAMGLDD